MSRQTSFTSRFFGGSLDRSSALLNSRKWLSPRVIPVASLSVTLRAEIRGGGIVTPLNCQVRTRCSRNALNYKSTHDRFIVNLEGFRFTGTLTRSHTLRDS